MDRPLARRAPPADRRGRAARPRRHPGPQARPRRGQHRLAAPRAPARRPLLRLAPPPADRARRLGRGRPRPRQPRRHHDRAARAASRSGCGPATPTCSSRARSSTWRRSTPSASSRGRLPGERTGHPRVRVRRAPRQRRLRRRLPLRAAVAAPARRGQGRTPRRAADRPREVPVHRRGQRDGAAGRPPLHRLGHHRRRHGRGRPPVPRHALLPAAGPRRAGARQPDGSGRRGRPPASSWRARSRPPTARASCTATSSRATSSSPPTTSRR